MIQYWNRMGKGDAGVVGKRAVVTGGAGGIGRAVVARFLGEGASVLACDLNRVGLEEVREQFDEHAERLHIHAADVSVEDEMRGLFRQAPVALGGIDCLVSCAGLGGAYGRITEVSSADWDRTFAALTRSVFLGIREAARLLIDQGGGGSLINIASIAGLVAGCAPHAYSAAKAAVVSLSHTAAIELAPFRIRVNSICPGVIVTPLIRRTAHATYRDVLARRQPWPDLGRPEDVADAALFLAADSSRFVTGTDLVVDGGLAGGGPNYANDLFPIPPQPGFDSVMRSS